MKQVCIALCLLLTTVLMAEERVWTNNQGKTMTAEYVGQDGDTVLLKRSAKGDLRRVKINSLSSADQHYVNQLNSPSGSESGYTDAGNTDIEAEATDIGGEAQTVVHKFEQAPQWLLGVLVGVALVVNIPLIILLGKGIFGDLNGFFDALKFWLKPDIMSWIHGEAFEDWIAEFKLGLFVALSIGLFVVEAYLVGSFVL